MMMRCYCQKLTMHRVAKDVRLDPRIRRFFEAVGPKSQLVECLFSSPKEYRTRAEYISEVQDEAKKWLRSLEKIKFPKIPLEIRKLWSKKGLEFQTFEVESLPDSNKIKMAHYAIKIFTLLIISFL